GQDKESQKRLFLPEGIQDSKLRQNLLVSRQSTASRDESIRSYTREQCSSRQSPCIRSAIPRSLVPQPRHKRDPRRRFHVAEFPQPRKRHHSRERRPAATQKT